MERVDERVPSFKGWVDTVPLAIRRDQLWEFETYQKALYLTELSWFDCKDLRKDSLGRPIADQLIRSAGSIAANIEEGYGRGFGKDYARFLRFSLGSARETRGWYYRGRRLLDDGQINHRIQLISEIIGGLVNASNTQRT